MTLISNKRLRTFQDLGGRSGSILKAPQDPEIDAGMDLDEITLADRDGIILLRRNNHPEATCI